MITEIEFELEGTDEYLSCPGCNLEGETYQTDMWIDGDVIIQEVNCKNCGRKIRNFFDFQCRAQEVVK